MLHVTCYVFARMIQFICFTYFSFVPFEFPAGLQLRRKWPDECVFFGFIDILCLAAELSSKSLFVTSPNTTLKSVSSFVCLSENKNPGKSIFWAYVSSLSHTLSDVMMNDFRDSTQWKWLIAICIHNSLCWWILVGCCPMINWLLVEHFNQIASTQW